MILVFDDVIEKISVGLDAPKFAVENLQTWLDTSEAELGGGEDLQIEVVQQMVLENGVPRKILGIFGMEEEGEVDAWIGWNRFRMKIEVK